MKLTIVIIATMLAILIGTCGTAKGNTNDSREVVIARVETERHIWIGTTTGVWQINKRNHKAVKFTSENSMLPSNNVTGICVGKYDNVFIATDNGILHYDNFALLVITSENSNLPSNHITSIASDNQDVLWIGTADKGLVKMYNGKCKVYNTSNSDMESNAVSSIEKDQKGNMVVRCQGETLAMTPNN